MELVAVLEIVLGVVVVHHVDLGLWGNAEHRDQRRHRRRALAGDSLLVGGDQRAFVQGHALRPEEQLGRAKHVRIVAIVERIAQNDVHQLIDEQVRDLDAAADDIEIGGFDGAVAGEMVAEGEHDLPVLARVGIRDRGDSSADTVRRGSASSAACSLRSAMQASGGGVSSGRARYTFRNSSVATSPPPASRSSRWWPQESQKSLFIEGAMIYHRLYHEVRACR